MLFFQMFEEYQSFFDDGQKTWPETLSSHLLILPLFEVNLSSQKLLFFIEIECLIY